MYTQLRRLFLPWTETSVVAVILMVVALIGFGHPAQGADNSQHSFPRLAGVQIAKKDYDDPGRQSDMAKMDLLIMGFYEGWSANGQSTRDVILALKNKNPNIVIFNYTNINEVNSTTGAQVEIREKLSAENGPNGNRDWYARDSAGNLTGSWRGTNTMNMTSHVTPDSNGMRLPQWYAGYVKRKFFDPVPEFDGIYIDVFRSQPLVDADWNGDGRNDSRSDATTITWYTEGQRAYRDALREIYPNHPVVVNATSWWQKSMPTAYSGALEGGLLEHAMGMSWSIEGTAADGTTNHWGSWDKMMTAYRNLMNDTIAPHFVVLDIRGNIDDYRLMRYGLASTLLHNGYFSFTDNNNVFSNVPWFDEYSVDLGSAIDSPPLVPWSNGVYRRDFTNGIVLVNPRGNGTKTVQLEPGLKRIRGTQDVRHNDGSVAETITLDDADGIILIRESVPPRPPATTVE